MRLLDPTNLRAFAPLVDACNAYAHFTGGRFLPEDFEGGCSHPGQEGFEDARKEAEESVATFVLLAKEKDESLVKEYEEAYRMTVHEAAIATMVAAFKALDRLPASGIAASSEDVGPEDVRRHDLDTLAMKVAAVDAGRKEKGRAAKLRAASFVADFGAAAGLERVACPQDDELLRLFHEKFRKDEESAADQAIGDAFAPYKELFSAGSLDDAMEWCNKHPDEVGVVASVGIAAVGLALIGLMARGRCSSSSSRTS